MMPKEKRNSKLVRSVLMFFAIAPVAWTQSQIVRNAASTEHVLHAMALAGVPVNSDQIELLAGSGGSTKESASVRVVSVSRGAGGTMKVKLRCQDNGECLPFYVLVHGLNEASAIDTRVHPVQAVETSAQPNVVRGGDRATLILESADSLMRLPVICLQGGARGQKIRVASLDHRQLFDAEIVSTGMLKGSL